MKLNNDNKRKDSKSFNQKLKSVLKFNLIIFLLIISFYLALGLTYSLDLKSVLKQIIFLENDLFQRAKVNKSLNAFNYSFEKIKLDNSRQNLSSKPFVTFSSFDFDNDFYSFNDHKLENQTYLTTERSIQRSVRSISIDLIPFRIKPSKSRKRRGNLSSKRKVKRVVFRADNWPFLKFLSTRNLFRKRSIRRNVRSSRLNARLPNRLRKVC